MKKETIDQFMTKAPHSVRHDLSMKHAHEMMREYVIRHLPVLKGGHLVGVITDRDIKLATSFRGVGELTVEEVMTPEPFCVKPGTALLSVVSEMIEHKYGCAIVAEGERVIGIFTLVDALRALEQKL